MTPFPRPDRDPERELDDLIREMAPPEPGAAEWDRVRTAIAARLIPVESRRAGGWKRQIGWAAAGGIAAAVAVVLLWPRSAPVPNPTTPQVEVAADPLAEYDVLPIATPNDLFISAIRGDGAIGFVACDHPLPGVMPLATATEMSLQWAQTGELSLPTPADAPIFVEVLDK